MTVNPSSTTVTPGEWCGNFPAATNYVSQHDLPLVMVWGKEECDHCTALITQLGASDALRWARGKNAVFCLVEGNKWWQDLPPNSGAMEFAGGVDGEPDYLKQTPFVRFYWPGRSSVRFEGRLGSMYSKEGSTLIAQFENSVEKFLSEMVLTKSYATFPMGDNPCDRLEAIRGVTQFVDVPVMRTNAVVSTANSTLSFACRGTTKSEGISWASGETLRFVRYEMPSGVVAGDVVTLTLTDADRTVLATRRIHVLAEDYENSPKNPYWFGERTAATLAWGDWSMDLDAVLQKVRTFNASKPAKKAHAMVFVGGSCWCPDCAMAEANFYSKKAFQDWAKANQVVFGVLDIPNFGKAAPEATVPSQLRYESSRTSDAFVTLRGTAPADETQRYQSGAGYLSRHSVPYTGNGGTNATDIASRNRFLMGHTVLEGGLNRPERGSTNPYRTGVPVLLLLRDDGTVAARWNRFSDVGPSAYSDGYLRRFEEMLAQATDDYEENDDDRSTTTREIGSGETVASTVSAVDQADVYALRGAAANEVVRFRVTGDAMPLRAVLIDGATGTELEATDGLASEGFTLSSKLRSGTASYCLKVEPKKIADGTAFGYTNAAATVCRYSVAVTSGESGGEFGFASATLNVMEDCGTAAIKVLRTAGSNCDASVRVHLAEATGEAVDERIEWTDAVLSWASGEEGEKTATLTVLPDGLVRHDLRLRFELVDLACDAEDKAVTRGELIVNVYDVDYFGMPVLRHVAAEDMRTVEGFLAGDEVTVVPLRGTLPEGLVVVNEGGRVGVAGHARDAAGEYSATYAVKVRRAGSEVSVQTMTFEFTVIDYDFAGTVPSLATLRTYGNLPQEEDGQITGMLTVTVPPDGRVSAKYVTGSKTYAYAADGWASFDEAAGVSASLVCTTPDVGGMTVALSSAGGVATLADPEGGASRVFALDASAWPRGARSWQGQYTVQMPQTNAVDGAGADRLGGAAYMAMRMTDADADEGRMLYAGVLPNGRAVYGSSVLLPTPGEAAEARLPFYHASDMKTAPYVLSGGFSITADAATDSTHLWCVTAAWPTFWEVADGFGRIAEFNVFGGYYDQDSIAEKFTSDLGDLGNLAFFADVSAIVSGRYGQGAEMAPVAAEMTPTNMPQLVAEDGENPQAVVLRFSLGTGVVSGDFNLPFEEREIAVTYRAIALPGWQNCAECSRRHFVERPWAAGAFSFSDRDRAAGTFRNGGAIRLDKVR